MADSTTSVYSTIKSSGGSYLSRDIAFRSFQNLLPSEGCLTVISEGLTIDSHAVTANSTPNSLININKGISFINIKVGTDTTTNADLYNKVQFETTEISRDIVVTNCPVSFGRKDLVCIKYVATAASASVKLVVVEGVASASPKYPTLPNDGSTTFYLPLAGISRVANASVVQNSDIITTGLTDRGTPSINIASIAWQVGSTVRYNLGGSPDLSAFSIGNSLIVTGATSAVNNGTFVITGTNNVDDWIEVKNTSVSSGATDQVGAVGTVIREERLRNSTFASVTAFNSYTSSEVSSLTKFQGLAWVNLTTGNFELYNNSQIQSVGSPLSVRTSKVTSSQIFR